MSMIGENSFQSLLLCAMKRLVDVISEDSNKTILMLMLGKNIFATSQSSISHFTLESMMSANLNNILGGMKKKEEQEFETLCIERGPFITDIIDTIITM